MKKHPLELGRRAGAGFLALVLALTLAACGGGGGNPGTTVGTGSGGSSASPTVALALVDGSGNAVNSLSGGQTATLRATVKADGGAPAANAIVNFAASDATLVEFTPATGSAMTDDKGVASINVKPATITSAGALSISATSVLNGKTATAALNMAVGAAPLTVGALSFAPPPAGSLPAFSTLSLRIPVTSGGQPVSSAPGLSMSSLCAGDGTATLVAGAISNGIQAATYTNNGCVRGRDTITVSIGNSTQTISVDVSPANIGTIQFVGTNMSGTSIVLKGSGGQGRSEAAQVTFRVVDQHNNGLPGVDVRFSATTYTGGLTVTPTQATTDAAGNVTAMVSSGTIPTPVRVIAEATRNGVPISGMSDTLTISTGLPIQRSMSMSAERYNIEGGQYDNEQVDITVLLADQYGNPVSDNTAINVVTEGGAVGTPAQGGCTTTDGGCTVSLRSQEFRPVNGRVTVLAYLQGLEDFVDQNGDGQYSCTNFRDPNGAVPPAYRPLIDTCVSGGESFTDMGDPFLDTGVHAVFSGVPATSGSLDNTYEANKGDRPFPYNRPSYSASGNGKWGLNYIRRSIEIVFSGSHAVLYRQVCSDQGCRDWTSADGDPRVLAGLAGAGCKAVPLVFRVADKNNNPMPAETTLTARGAEKVSLSELAPRTVPSTNAIGGTIHGVTVKPASDCSPGGFAVDVTTPRGNTTTFAFQSN